MNEDVYGVVNFGAFVVLESLKEVHQFWLLLYVLERRLDVFSGGSLSDLQDFGDSAQS